MKRKIIEIDEAKCDGCGQCITGCHEGALALVDGKAKLVKDNFCDGLGACIGDCPRDALHIIEREAEEFDLAAVEAAQRAQGKAPTHNVHIRGPAHGHGHGHHAGGGCPGSAVRSFQPQAPAPATDDQPPPSLLAQWPVQLMLVPPGAPFLRGADLVICADCVPFAVPDFHARYLQGRAVVVGCPKLDDVGFYEEKLTEMFRQAKPKRVTVLRMEVPCCGGISHAAIQAAAKAGAATGNFTIEEHTIGVRGGIERNVIRE